MAFSPIFSSMETILIHTHIVRDDEHLILVVQCVAPALLEMNEHTVYGSNECCLIPAEFPPQTSPFLHARVCVCVDVSR